MNTITMDEYDEKYKPITKDGEQRQFLGAEEALDFVKEHLTTRLPYRHIWAAVHGDEEYYSLFNGFHVCNILHFEVCMEPWGTDDHEGNGKINIEAKEEDICSKT